MDNMKQCEKPELENYKTNEEIKEKRVSIKIMDWVTQYY